MMKFKICIVGLGYVGLPLAVEFGKKQEIIGYDINKARIEELNQGIDSTNESTVVINDVIGSVVNNVSEIASIYESSTNIYNIEFINPSEYTFVLYDNIGNKLKESVNNSNTKVDLNNFSNGVYWIIINKADKTYKAKLMKFN